MAANIYDLSTTAASNTTIDGVDVSGTTGKVKDGDNVMRSLGAYMAQVLDDLGGVATTAGTANAQTVTLASGFTANASGHVFTVKIGSGLTNTSTTVNLNVNSIGNVRVKAYDIATDTITDPHVGAISEGNYATFLDNGTNFILLNPVLEESGTWTPVVTPASGSLTAYTSAGTYKKIGSIVHITYSITITTGGTASGVMTVSGLPFTTGGSVSGAVREDVVGGSLFAVYAASGATSMSINVYNNAGANYTDTARYNGSLTYRT